MLAIVHRANWYAGWALLLSAFVSGAGIGLFFHREDFWGGYGSFRRRIVRLGHISLAALGMVNLLFALSVTCAGQLQRVAPILLIIGGSRRFSLAIPLHPSQRRASGLAGGASGASG